MMQALGVNLDVIDRCQNHVLAGSRVRRHYLHHDYAREKAEAWARLGTQLESIIFPKGMEHTQQVPEQKSCEEFNSVAGQSQRQQFLA